MRAEYGSTLPERWRLAAAEQDHHRVRVPVYLLLLRSPYDLGISQRIRLECRVPRNAGEATGIQAAPAVDRRRITRSSEDLC